MLGKLLKYEIKATARTFLPLYLAIIVLALINKVFLSFQFEYGTMIGLLTLFGVFVALAVVTFVLLITRFYKNLLADEGYLMFTLPVGADSLIWSKLIVTMLWIILSCVVAVVTIIVLVWQSSIPIQDIMYAIKLGFAKIAENQAFGIIVQLIIAMVLGIITSIIMIYASIAIGQLPPFSNNRVAGAFVAFIAINVVETILGIILALLFGLNFESTAIGPDIGITILTWANVISLLETVVLYIVTRVILKKHLNLA